MTGEAEKSSAEMTQPVIVDLGRQKRAAVRSLKRGEGKLWDEVLDVVKEVKEMLGADADGKVLVPVVMVYRERSRYRLSLDRMLNAFLDDDEDDENEDDDADEDEE